MSKQKNNVNDLLAAIKRQPTSPTSEKAGAETAAAVPQAKEKPPKIEVFNKSAADKKVKSHKGGPVQFWMHDEDRKLIRELSAWLAGQGIRPTDSMVIRAVLRVAKTGSALLEACEQAAKVDGRLKRN
jgi:hypothetical protein